MAMVAFEKLMARLGFVRLGRYGLALTPEDRVIALRPVLDDGDGRRVVGWTERDLASTELAPWSTVPSLVSPSAQQRMAMPRPPAPVPVAAPAVARAASVAEPEEDWEWTLAVARARAAAEDVVVRPAVPVALAPKADPKTAPMRVARMPTPAAGSAADGRRGETDGRGSAAAGSAAEGRRGVIDGRGTSAAGSAAEGRRGETDGRGTAAAGSAAEGRRGETDGRGTPAAGSAAEGRRGETDGRGTAAAGSAAEGRRGVIDTWLEPDQQATVAAKPRATVIPVPALARTGSSVQPPPPLPRPIVRAPAAPPPQPRTFARGTRPVDQDILAANDDYTEVQNLIAPEGEHTSTQIQIKPAPSARAIPSIKQRMAGR